MAGHQAVLGLYYTHPIEYTLTVNKLWSRRLTVRTPGFHPGNRGSIPRGITIREKSAETSFGAFLFNL